MAANDELQDFLEPPRPAVVIWFKIYAGLLCLVYFGVMVMGISLFFIPAEELDLNEMTAPIFAGLFLVLGFLLFVGCLIPLVVRPQPWVWVYDLIVICLGMTSACCIFVSIPLLIFWLKPETKQYFGRT